jgi:tetratricopeptide (TPR) repeat protein
MAKLGAYLFLACILPFTLLVQFSFALDSVALDHARRGDTFLQQGLQFQAITEYRRAMGAGVDHPDLYRNLAIALFEVGLLDEAIAELEKAVELYPDGDLMHLELGVLYLARSRLDDARTQLFQALERNPGSAASYYYLAEYFFSAGQYDYAWLAARMALLMGHPGGEVIRGKLAGVSPEPAAPLWHLDENQYHIRQILVESRQVAEKLVERLRQGELFEDIAGVESLGPNIDQGGYTGSFQAAELHLEIIKGLAGNGMLGDPFIFGTEEQVQIVQQIPPFDFEFWRTSREGSAPAPTAAEDAGPEKGQALGAGAIKAPAALPLPQAGPSPVETEMAGLSAAQEVRVITPAQQKRKLVFTIHVGIFNSAEEAEERLDRLRALDLPGYTFEEKKPEGRVTFGVVAAKTGSYLAVREAMEKLKSLGLDYFIHQDYQELEK